MTVQWYPGHMTKALRMMENEIKLVDLVIEILDARAPLSSRNPDIDKLAGNKLRLIVMNKADLADASISKKWENYFAGLNIKTVFVNSKNKEGMKNVLPSVREVCKDRIARNEAKGIKNQPIRAMIAGIPNVGKSTFINALAGSNKAKTGNKPGVTVGKQWIGIGSDIALLDTPGILWPKFSDQEVGKRLAYLGSINDEILISEELAGELLLYLFSFYPANLYERYGINEEALEEEEAKAASFYTKQSLMLDIIARKRGTLKSGAESDYFKTANLVLEDFRSGKLGRITLEQP